MNLPPSGENRQTVDAKDENPLLTAQLLHMYIETRVALSVYSDTSLR